MWDRLRVDPYLLQELVMRPIDDDGNPVRVRGRDFYATINDTVDFLKIVLENIPGTRLYENELIKLGKMTEITPENWAAKEMPWREPLLLLFHDGSWDPSLKLMGMTTWKVSGSPTCHHQVAL